MLVAMMDIQQCYWVQQKFYKKIVTFLAVPLNYCSNQAKNILAVLNR
ncbi:Uncharacterised protein [Mycobacteroides abscessus subsp. abscessus]|nr:Uncharacterised protein [Mycobacteroides abscessus subsp. abscessus]